MKPRARKNKLIVQELGNEVLIHDRVTKRTHRLNALAAGIWRNCDGKHSMHDLRSHLDAGLDDNAASIVLERAVADLTQAGLVNASQTCSHSLPPSRRQVVKTLMAAGFSAFVLPVVLTTALSTAARAADECKGKGAFNVVVTGEPSTSKEDALLSWNEAAFNKCEEMCAKFHCRTDDRQPDACRSDADEVSALHRLRLHKVKKENDCEPTQWYYDSDGIACHCYCPPR